MKNWLKCEWFNLMSQYLNDNVLIETLWAELKNQYEHKSRYYHNFKHIYKMLKQLEAFKTEIKDINVLKFAIWYHDVIYKSTKKDNEEKSAAFALNRLKT